MNNYGYMQSLLFFMISITNMNSNFYHNMYGCILDSMGFPNSPRTPKSEFGQRRYDLPKLEIMRSQPRRADLTWTSSIYHLGLKSNILIMHFNVFLTQWALHRVQEHPNRSSDEGDMTFRSWRSCVVNPDELT